MEKTILQKYKPLIIIFLIINLVSLALASKTQEFSQIEYMHNFMGLFFVFFSMFKLFDMQGFVKGFQMYDIFAKKSKYYGYLYPFIEIALGYAYLSNFQPSLLINITTAVIMFFSAYGVIKSIKSGMNLKCACLGTALDVPLSTVSIIENVGMGLMAAYMIVYGL